jgi:hypothetical protein
MAIEQEDEIFQTLFNIIHEQQELITSIAEKLTQLEWSGGGGGGGGGGGSAIVTDYQSDQHYKRNTLVVDTATETLYRVINEYTSITVQQDCMNGNLKLVGFESQVITFDHNPTQSEINVLPEDSLVAIYSAADTPYQPDLLE